MKQQLIGLTAIFATACGGSVEVKGEHKLSYSALINTVNQPNTGNGALTMAITRRFVNLSVNPGDQGVRVLRLSVKNTTPDHFEIQEFIFDAFNDDNDDLFNGPHFNVRRSITRCVLVEDGMFGSPLQLTTASAIGDREQLRFENFRWIVKSNTSSEVYLDCDFADVPTNSGDDDWVNFNPYMLPNQGIAVTRIVHSTSPDAGVGADAGIDPHDCGEPETDAGTPDGGVNPDSGVNPGACGNLIPPLTGIQVINCNPRNSNVLVGADDHVFQHIAIMTAEDVVFTNMGVFLSCVNGADCDFDSNDSGGLVDGNASENFSDMALRLPNGGIYMQGTSQNNLDDALQLYDMYGQRHLNAGEVLHLYVTGDVANNTDAGFVGNRVRTAFDTRGIQGIFINGNRQITNNDIVPSNLNLFGGLMTVSHASLDIEATRPPSHGRYVKGASHVDVLGLNMSAGSDDVMVRHLTISAIADDDVNGFVSRADVNVRDHVNSCSMFDAEFGTHLSGPEPLSADDTILFENLGYHIDAGDTRKILVRCNFANIQTDSNNDDEYAFFLDSVHDVDAELSNGDALTPSLGEDNDDGSETTITITNSGALNIVRHGSSPKSDIILGNSTGILMAVYRFEAYDEDFIVEKVTLSNCIAWQDPDGDCSDGGEVYGADDIAAAVKLEYLAQDGTLETKTGFLSGGTMTRGSMNLFVPANGTALLKVRIDTNEVSSVAASSGDQIQLNLNAVDGSLAEFEAHGLASGETLNETDMDMYVISNNMTIRKTRPTVTLHAASPSGLSVPGMNELLRFNIAADSRGFITLNSILFEVSASDGDASGWNQCGDGGGTQYFADPDLWSFYDATDPSERLDDDGDWTFFNSNGLDCTDDTTDLMYAELNFNGSTITPAIEIGAGYTTTFVVEVNTSGASSSEDDSIRLSIPDQATASGLQNSLKSIDWDDDVEASGIDGEYIKNLPLDGGTSVY